MSERDGIEGPPKPKTRPAKTKSAASNGNRVFALGGDGRGAWSRRQRDIAQLHIDDLGGEAHLSEAQLSLCRRTATLEVTLEQLEAKMSEGQDVDHDQYGGLYGHLRRGKTNTRAGYFFLGGLARTFTGT